MRNSNAIRLLLMLLLIGVFGASALAQQPSQPDKSQSPSPVKTNALELLAELEAPSTCSPDDTLCLAEIFGAKLRSAIAGVKSIVRIDEQREGVIADMQKRIDIRGGIIDDLSKVDKNNQRIDTLGQENAQIFRDQIRDDKETIGSLRKDLASCQSNQKWIFGAGALAGGFVGYKIRGAGVIQNPFASFSAQSQGYPFSFYQQTRAEKALREALKQK